MNLTPLTRLTSSALPSVRPLAPAAGMAAGAPASALSTGDQVLRVLRGTGRVAAVGGASLLSGTVAGAGAGWVAAQLTDRFPRQSDHIEAAGLGVGAASGLAAAAVTAKVTHSAALSVLSGLLAAGSGFFTSSAVQAVHGIAQQV